MPIQSVLAGTGGKIHSDDLMGFLVMFSVSETMVSYPNIVREWAREGLDMDVMPNPARPIDTFQLACQSVKTDRRGQNVIIMVEPANKIGDAYQITRSVRDSANQLVDHPKGMTLIFDRTQGEGAIKVVQLDDYDEVRELATRVRKAYVAFKDQIPPNKVRRAVRDTIVNHLGGTNYMSKGVYMVPKKHLNALESIERVLKAAYGEGAQLVMIPTLNTTANQNDLSRFHADDMRERAEELIATVAAKLSTGAVIRKDMLANVMRAQRELREQRQAVFDMIGRETESVDDRLDIVAAQVQKLAEAASREEVAA